MIPDETLEAIAEIKNGGGHTFDVTTEEPIEELLRDWLC